MRAHLAPAFWVPDRVGVLSAWWGHVPFAHWLIAATRPGLVVELGTHTGVSYAAFCRAVAELGLPTRCVAVDTWRGDPQAGTYDQAVYEELRAWHDPRHSAFSRLLRNDFDSARRLFAPGSIDLLHIDGRHDDASVRHDLTTWLPAMSARGVVLFHDTAIREPGFDVWRLWEEVRHRWPGFLFEHCYGLGVLAVGPRPPAAEVALCAAAGTPAEAVLRQAFAVLGERWMLAQAMDAEQQQATALADALDAARREIAQLRASQGAG